MGQRITSAAGGGSQRSHSPDAKGHLLPPPSTVSGVTIVDTGATMVTINSNQAKSAGIAYTSGERGMMQTANGVTVAYKIN
jgi:predicted aspartyl protease